MNRLRHVLSRTKPLLARVRRVLSRTKPLLARVRRVLSWMALRVDLLLVVVAVGLISWAAFDIDPIAGRIVAGVGLLYLGGGIGRFAREIRGG